ncbi:MAG: YitT family protein [Lachnospiraceae bacterium]|nr:YitT family protein [Lachnospiraceae bacterium]
MKKKIAYIVLGAVICSFGIYNIHQQTGVTEGGVIGTMLLIHHWLGLKPSVITPILDISCYIFAYKYLGSSFIKTSIISTMSVSLFFKIWEQFPPILPDLSAYPFVAAILGGIFVGVGVGLIVRQGGSSGGDDALALAISKVTHCRLSKAYMFTDFTVLILSLSYIPFNRIVFSIITVTISSYIIDFIQQFGEYEGVELEEG